MTGVHHAYDGREVHHGIDLSIERAEVFGFLGHHGAGKTTAINILTTLMAPTSGAPGCVGSMSSRSGARLWTVSGTCRPRFASTGI